jgi:hypothetical protein
MSEFGNWTIPLLSLLVATCSLLVAILTYRRVSRKYVSKTLHFPKEIPPEKELTLFNILGEGSLKRIEMTAKGSQYAWITLIVDEVVYMKESFEGLLRKSSHFLTVFRLPQPHAEGEFSLEVDLQESFSKNFELRITNTNSDNLLLKVKGTVHYDVYEPRFHLRKERRPSG